MSGGGGGAVGVPIAATDNELITRDGGKFWIFSEIFKIVKIRDSSFIALLILRRFI